MMGWLWVLLILVAIAVFGYLLLGRRGPRV